MGIYAVNVRRNEYLITPHELSTMSLERGQVYRYTGIEIQALITHPLNEGKESACVHVDRRL